MNNSDKFLKGVRHIQEYISKVANKWDNSGGAKCYEDKNQTNQPPPPQKTGTLARPSWSCCPALHLSLPPHPQHSSFLLILKEKPHTLSPGVLISFSFICQHFPLSLCYSCLNTNPPTRKATLRAGVITLAYTSLCLLGTLAQIRSSQNECWMNWWIPWHLNHTATKASPAQIGMEVQWTHLWECNGSDASRQWSEC